jgi:hypothetical protein
MNRKQVERIVVSHLSDMATSGVYPLGVIFDVTEPLNDNTAMVPCFPNIAGDTEEQLTKIIDTIASILRRAMEEDPTLREIVAKALYNLYMKDETKDEIDPDALRDFIRKHTQ